MKHTCHIILIAVLTICNAAYAQKTTSRIEKNLSIYNDVLRQLDITYADTLNYDDLVATSIHQMLKKIDPYTVYIPEDKTQDLRLMTTGKYGGIGAMIMQRQDSMPAAVKRFKPKGAADRYVNISEPYENMPAQKNDLRAGDILIEVDGKNVVGKTTAEVSALLRGVPHSVLNLKVLRPTDDKPFTIAFEREEITLPPVSYFSALRQADYPDTDFSNKHIGYILFSEFTENSADLFRQAVDEMIATDSINALIIDLRNNGGGIIDEAVKIMGLFVDKGTEIVSTKGKNKNSNRTYRTTTQPRYKDMQVAVIVNHNSASAAEIVAGSMQDLDRATLIGTRTYGKGLVQSIRPIAYNGHLKVTTSKYYIPSGRCIQAIDYSKRRADGSVERVPDSLIHEFKTLQGRIVRDGGGIEPDIVIDDSSKFDITYPLYAQQYIFDYATIYRNTHSQIAPASEFALTDADIDDFVDFLTRKGFTYETETARFYKAMLEVAHKEDIDSTLLKQLDDIKEKLNPPFVNAVNQHKDEVRDMLAAEIVQRYWFQKGAIAYSLKGDEQIIKAIEQFNKQ